MENQTEEHKATSLHHHQRPMPRRSVPLRRWRRQGGRLLGYLSALASSIVRPRDWPLLLAAYRLHHATPRWMATPLPQTMQRITPPLRPPATGPLTPGEARRRTRLIDAVVHLDRTVPLGICLRRSLVRYVLLRQEGLPVTIIFGARPTQLTAGLAAHAWLELDGQPWMEPPENIEGFAIMYRYPPEGLTPQA